jgi:(R,R)-butanediol dehydrogenase/meso-butanediol dehydrogenase/diacetyl reductase
MCRAGLEHFCREGKHLGSTGSPGLGGLAPFVSVPAAHVLPAPNGLDPGLITLAEPLANALRALDRPEVEHAATAVVIGCGPLGLMHLAALRHMGIDRVVAIEGRARRREAALELGAELVLDPSDNITAEVAAHFGPGPDLVVEAVGTKATTHLATDLVRPRGSVFLMGVCGEPFRVNTLRWLNKEITIRTSIGTSRDEQERGLALIATGAIDLSCLITRRISLAETPVMFEALDAGTDEIKVVVTHDHSR